LGLCLQISQTIAGCRRNKNRRWREEMGRFRPKDTKLQIGRMNKSRDFIYNERTVISKIVLLLKVLLDEQILAVLGTKKWVAM
jgi:hypothetical protein